MLGRLRQKASGILGRGSDKEDLALSSPSDCTSLLTRECSDTPKVFTGLSFDYAEGRGKSYFALMSESYQTDHVQRQSQAGGTVTPTPNNYIVRDQEISRLTPKPSSVMASSAVGGGFYRPVNPSILAGFDSEPDEDAPVPTVTMRREDTPSSRRPGPQSQPPARPTFQYRVIEEIGRFENDRPSEECIRLTVEREREEKKRSKERYMLRQRQKNASQDQPSPSQTPLSVFDEATEPGRGLNAGLVPTQTGPPQVQPPSTPASASTIPARSNNPYVGLIEARQNAMTTNFLRSQHTLAGGQLPPYPDDEYGYACPLAIVFLSSHLPAYQVRPAVPGHRGNSPNSRHESAHGPRSPQR